MKNRTTFFLELWQEARTRFSNQVKNLSSEDLKKKLQPSQNTAGFLLRHIGDVELLFAKNVFGANETKVIAKTVIAQHDSGEWTNLQELLDYINESYKVLQDVIQSQTDEQWEEVITTKEFGTKTKAEALGRIVSHTAYHAGQLALTLKYGST